ncbi:MAG: hypothetical protein M3063_07030 [Actinomycetota bacterium]|nr:hypothetical protein [Actinomycetota bacterium]
MRHAGQHGSSTDGDALDLWETQDKVLLELFEEWDSNSDGQWDHGTTGKLILEHAAVREGALDDVAAALRKLGEHSTATALLDSSAERRQTLDRLDKQTFGREPAAINYNAEFVEAADNLRDRLRNEIHAELNDTIPHLRDTVFADDAEDDLHSARFVRKHAPTHPNPNRHRYGENRFIKRIHTVYDRIRGFPWPESKPFMDQQLAEKYHQE